MLFCKADVRTDDAVQVRREQGQVRYGFLRQRDAFWQFLRIRIIEVGNDAPHEGRCLQADIPFAVRQELVEELQGHEFLMFRHVRRIFLENADIGANILPQPFAAGRFDEEDAHETDIVVDSGIL